jgi:hypothetical protein
VTQEELDTLPECGGIGYIVEGNRRIPFAQNSFALYQGPDDPLMVLDLDGQRWTVGWAHGKRWKRKFSS